MDQKPIKDLDDLESESDQPTVITPGTKSEPSPKAGDQHKTLMQRFDHVRDKFFLLFLLLIVGVGAG